MKKERSQEKIVTLNFDVLRDRAASTAKKAASKVGKRLTKVRKAVAKEARSRTDQVFALVLDKGIAASEKGLKSLRKVRKNFDAGR